MTLAKICGLTTPETLTVALDAGAALTLLAACGAVPRLLSLLTAASTIDDDDEREARGSRGSASPSIAPPAVPNPSPTTTGGP